MSNGKLDHSFRLSRRSMLAGVGSLAAPSAWAQAQSTVDRPGTSKDAAAPTAPSKQSDVVVAHGREITLSFDVKRCVHARFCVAWQPNVYREKENRIDPDADTVERSVAVVHNCPSGALQYERHDGGPPEPAPRVNMIYLRENGPLAVRANMVIDGKSVGYRATLCRCGASKHKPFCDTSHRTVGFKSTAEPDTVPSEDLAVRDGLLTISPERNGPLHIRGNVEICSGTGRVIKNTTSERLCRCGKSGKQPFCDDSHVAYGFSTDEDGEKL
jgi:CDGSH-type Zn-finger protein/uncharacterized Fe-S cluster protein YjdI